MIFFRKIATLEITTKRNRQINNFLNIIKNIAQCPIPSRCSLSMVLNNQLGRAMCPKFGHPVQSSGIYLSN